MRQQKHHPIAERLARQLHFNPTPDKASAAGPMNRQLYQAIRQNIVTGAFPAGTRLPSSRLLAGELGVSRNTVLFAYEQLLAEGYISTSTGSGSYVSESFASPVNTGPDTPADGPLDTPLTALPEKNGLSRRGVKLLEHAGASDRQWGAFVGGVPDVSLFPHKLWARLLGRQWRRPQPALLTYAHHGGHLLLRQALAEHLHMVRGTNGDANQVIITTGIHQALDLTARLLGDPGDTAWVEDPGYWGTRSVLSSAGITIKPVPLDAEGMAPDDTALRHPPRLIFVTPSHQYPVGTVMSMSRRLMLLDYARQHNAWIIEDDYDSEFRFEGRPLESLQGLDQHARVIYMGTFSKTLFPGMRLGYMLVPRALARQFAAGLSELYREGQLMQQAVLAQFILEGHYAAHIRRMRQLYATRRGVLRDAIDARLGKEWPTSAQEAGLHLLLQLPPGTDDQAISRSALERGVIARPLSRYYQQGSGPGRGLVLGYACVPDAAITPAFDTLSTAIEAELARVPG